MALVIPKYKIIVMQPPRTGTRSRRAMLRLAPFKAYVYWEHGRLRGGHCAWMDLPSEFRDPSWRVITWVRNPVEWMKSWWANRMSMRNWGDNKTVGLDIARSNTFKGFVLNYLDRCPGRVGETFARYMPPEEITSIVCKTENMTEEFRFALRMFGVPCEIPAVDRHLGRTLTRLRRRTRINRELVRLICKEELQIVNQWYPDWSRSLRLQGIARRRSPS